MPSDKDVFAYLYYDIPTDDFEASDDLDNLQNILSERQISEIRQIQLTNEVFNITKNNLDAFIKKLDKFTEEDKNKIQELSLDLSSLLEVGESPDFNLMLDLLNNDRSTELSPQGKSILEDIFENDRDFLPDLYFYYTDQQELIERNVSLEDLSRKNI